MEYPSTSAPRMQGWCNRLNTNTWREQALSTVGAGQKRNGHISHYTNKHQLIYIYIQKTSRQRKNVKMNPKLPHRHGQPGFWSKKWHPPRSWGLGFSPGKVFTASKTHAKRQIHLQNLLFLVNIPYLDGFLLGLWENCHFERILQKITLKHHSQRFGEMSFFVSTR